MIGYENHALFNNQGKHLKFWCFKYSVTCINLETIQAMKIDS